MPSDDPILRLARQIDAAKQTEHRHAEAADVSVIRRRAAAELHAICVDFVASVNSRLSRTAVDLSPPAYLPETFRESGVNLFQISSQGRQIQISFQTPRELVSTEKFLVPYVLEGEVRTYNQKMLERFEIRSLMLFYCLEDNTAEWRFYDWRTLHTGPVNRAFLVELMERLF